MFSWCVVSENLPAVKVYFHVFDKSFKNNVIFHVRYMLRGPSKGLCAVIQVVIRIFPGVISAPLGVLEGCMSAGRGTHFASISRSHSILVQPERYASLGALIFTCAGTFRGSRKKL